MHYENISETADFIISVNDMLMFFENLLFELS